jgi:16S rRNA (cytosine967-C5)-methyltransferase
LAGPEGADQAPDADDSAANGTDGSAAGDGDDHLTADPEGDGQAGLDGDEQPTGDVDSQGAGDESRERDGDKRHRRYDGEPPTRSRSGDGLRDGPGRRNWSAQSPSERQRTADPPRRAAYDLLRAVDGGAYANLALPAMLTERRISGRDAAFATELGYGTIRMQGQYDAVIGRVAGRDEIDPEVMDILRLGLHQIGAMRVPDHAAVAATVAIAREAVGAGSAGFVNAVLRAVTERTYEAWLDEVAPADDDSVEVLAIRHSHPAWVIRALRQALIVAGREAEDLVAVLTADNGQPPLTLAARPGLIKADQLAAQVEALSKRPAGRGRFAPSAVIMERGAPGDLMAVRQGRAGVQDEGSQLVAWALARAEVADDQGRWLDLCAGPGGKAALLGGIVRDRGGHLTANEPQAHRAELVRGAVKHMGDAVSVTELDGREMTGQFDRVLVDAPCTGLGALRRRPEARWRHAPSDLGALGPLQRQLLRAGVEATRPGGIVVYATCSPHLAESRLVVEDILAEREDAAVIDARQIDLIPGDAVGEDGLVQLWTDRHGVDAMFMAFIRRA